MLFSCFQAPGAAGATAGTAMNVNVVLRVKPLEQDYTGAGTMTVMGEGTVAMCAPVPATRDRKGQALAVNDQVDLSKQDKYDYPPTVSICSPCFGGRYWLWVGVACAMEGVYCVCLTRCLLPVHPPKQSFTTTTAGTIVNQYDSVGESVDRAH